MCRYGESNDIRRYSQRSKRLLTQPAALRQAQHPKLKTWATPPKHQVDAPGPVVDIEAVCCIGHINPWDGDLSANLDLCRKSSSCRLSSQVKIEPG